MGRMISKGEEPHDGMLQTEGKEMVGLRFKDFDIGMLHTGLKCSAFHMHNGCLSVSGG